MTDTVKLLKECDSGTKMAVSSFDEVMDKVSDANLKRLLTESKETHEKLGNKTHAMLSDRDSDGKEPNIMAKSMSWMKTNMKMGMNGDDSVIADLITDGCNMGVKSLNKFLNQFEAAGDEAKHICRSLISAEEKLAADLRRYL